jgi:hypothetical protein
MYENDEEHDPAIEAFRAERAAGLALRDVEEKRRIVLDLENAFFTFDHEGAVCTFKKKFNGSNIVYAYAALNVAGRWYTTGSTNRDGFTTEDFILWLASGNEPTREVDFL